MEIPDMLSLIGLEPNAFSLFTQTTAFSWRRCHVLYLSSTFLLVFNILSFWFPLTILMRKKGSKKRKKVEIGADSLQVPSEFLSG